MQNKTQKPYQRTSDLIDDHIERCREYSRRKSRLLEQCPGISSDGYQEQINRIARKGRMTMEEYIASQAGGE